MVVISGVLANLGAFVFLSAVAVVLWRVAGNLASRALTGMIEALGSTGANTAAVSAYVT